MLKLFNTTEIISEKDINIQYPNSMYMLQDVKDPNNVKGILLAVSTDKKSYRDICIKRKGLADRGIDCALLGSYNGGAIGVLSNSNR